MSKKNIEVKFYIPISEGRYFNIISNLSKTLLGNGNTSVIQARTDKLVFKVKYNEKLFRFDFGQKYLVNINEQKIASETINIPKILFVDNIKKYKISEWIDGVDINKVWNLPEVFIQSGELMGKLNLIKNTNSGMYLSNCEFSSSNAIWSNDKKVYLIDLGKLRWSSCTDITIVQVLLKRIRNKEKIDLFLEGYSKFKSTEKIIKICNQKNWSWK